MESRYLLGVRRLIRMVNPEREIPQTSVVSVNINREEIEEIRKNKGVYIRTFEEKINLSKSRYYRWLKYDIDLPMEYIVSMTKILGISFIELEDLFVDSTDELLRILLLTVDLSLKHDEKSQQELVAVAKELEKFRFSREDTQLYQLILIFCDMIRTGSKESVKHYGVERIESYLSKIEYFTLYDIVLYLGVLNFKHYHRIKISYVEQNIDSFIRMFLAKIQKNKLVFARSFFLGSILDLSLILRKNQGKLVAYDFLKQAQSQVLANWTISPYDQQLFDLALFSNVTNAEQIDTNISSVIEEWSQSRDLEKVSDEKAFVMTYLIGSM